MLTGRDELACNQWRMRAGAGRDDGLMRRRVVAMLEGVKLMFVR